MHIPLGGLLLWRGSGGGEHGLVQCAAAALHYFSPCMLLMMQLLHLLPVAAAPLYSNDALLRFSLCRTRQPVRRAGTSHRGLRVERTGLAHLADFFAALFEMGRLSDWSVRESV